MARSKGGSVAFGLLYGSSRSGSEHLNYPDRNKGWPNRLVLVHKGTLGSRLASALSAQTADCLCCDLTMWASSLFSPAGAGLALTIFLSRTAAFCLLRICHSNSCFGMISDYAVFAGLRACPIGFTFSGLREVWDAIQSFPPRHVRPAVVVRNVACHRTVCAWSRLQRF
jgi:hypothetical protein